ncbi:MAG: adenylate/guanylate cyclase domain-containing protein [Bacteroidia bacterium]
MPYKILVVDDEPDLELLITQKFRSKIREGELHFDFAGNGAIALDKIISNTSFDLIFTDINMPVMDGLTLLARIKEQELINKTIVVSAYGDIANIRLAMNRGAFDFVTKPIDLADLETTMYKAIHELDIFRQGLEAKINLDRTMREKEIALLEKAEAQREALENLQEKEKLILHQNEMLEQKVEERTRELMLEKKKSDELLLNILPDETAQELKETGTAKAKNYHSVSVLFTDFKGFTAISEKLSPEELVAEINYCFSAFDNIIQKYDIEKIKTIGDAYMCAGGLPIANESHPVDLVKAAIEIRSFMLQHLMEKEKLKEITFEIRIGINTGPVVAGIVGLKKFAYDIWGDTVNIASRMESTSEPGKINVSGSTYQLIKDTFQCTYRGKLSAKNKGEIEMYFVEDLLS